MNTSINSFIILSITLFQHVSAIVQPHVVVTWNNKKKNLRSTCSVQDFQAVDAILARELSQIDVAGSHYYFQDMMCSNQICEASLPQAPFVEHQDTEEREIEVAQELETVCNSVLADLSSETLFEGPCHNILLMAECEVSLTVSTL